MSLVSSVAMSTAIRVEAVAGPKAGLAVWRKLADASTGVLRGRALLGALRCAVALRDHVALAALADLWATVDSGIFSDALSPLVKRMASDGMLVPATRLAASEVKRFPSARAHYVYARCLDVAGDARAAEAFQATLVRADVEGACELARTARVRVAVWLSRSRDSLEAALEEARLLDGAALEGAERRAIARVLLRSPSRFERAGAIALLEPLVLSGDARAMLLVAEHLDDAGDGLSSLEAERAVAVLGRHPSGARAREVARALARIADAGDLDGALAAAAALDPTLATLHECARSVLAGRWNDASVPASAANDTGAVLAAAAALRDRRSASAISAIRTLAEAQDRGERLSPAAWTIALAGLSCEEAEVWPTAGRLAASLLARASAVPPRGFSGLARALAVRGMEELSVAAQRAAASAREPGAREALVLSLTRAGWREAEKGERSRALASLRQAKALSESGGSRTSSGPLPAASRST